MRCVLGQSPPTSLLAAPGGGRVIAFVVHVAWHLPCGRHIVKTCGWDGHRSATGVHLHLPKAWAFLPFASNRAGMLVLLRFNWEDNPLLICVP